MDTFNLFKTGVANQQKKEKKYANILTNRTLKCNQSVTGSESPQIKLWERLTVFQIRNDAQLSGVSFIQKESSKKSYPQITWNKWRKKIIQKSSPIFFIQLNQTDDAMPLYIVTQDK